MGEMTATGSPREVTVIVSPSRTARRILENSRLASAAETDRIAWPHNVVIITTLSAPHYSVNAEPGSARPNLRGDPHEIPAQDAMDGLLLVTLRPQQPLDFGEQLGAENFHFHIGGILPGRPIF